MNRDFDRPRQPLRTFHAQWAAALLAGLGAAIVQVAWLEAFKPRTAQSSMAIACLLVAVTAYLIASLWFHAASRQRPRRWRGNRLAELGRGLACDCIVGGVVLAVLSRGHNSGVLRLGLWIVPPTLLAFSAASTVVTLLAWRDIFVRLSDGSRLPHAAFVTSRLGWARMACSLLLVSVLTAVEATTAS